MIMLLKRIDFWCKLWHAGLCFVFLLSEAVYGDMTNPHHNTASIQQSQEMPT